MIGYDIGLRHTGCIIATLAFDKDINEIVAAQSRLDHASCTDVVKAAGSTVRNCLTLTQDRALKYLTATVRDHLKVLTDLQAADGEPVDLVICEQQPGRAGKKQYTLTYIIETCYDMHFAEHPQSSHKPQILAQTGAGKLNVASRRAGGNLVLDPHAYPDVTGLTRAQIYDVNKEYALEVGDWFVCNLSDENIGPGVAEYMAETHRYDMADALLHAAYYCLKRSPLPPPTPLHVMASMVQVPSSSSSTSSSPSSSAKRKAADTEADFGEDGDQPVKKKSRSTATKTATMAPSKPAKTKEGKGKSKGKGKENGRETGLDDNLFFGYPVGEDGVVDLTQPATADKQKSR